MGKLIAVVNNTSSPIYVGDQVVVPGNCRHFPEEQVPHHLRPLESDAAAPAPAAAPPADQDRVAEAFGCKPDELVERIQAAIDIVPEGAESVEELQEGRERCQDLLNQEQASAKPRPAVVEALGILQLAIGEGLVKAEAARAKGIEEAQKNAAEQSQAPAAEGGTPAATPPAGAALSGTAVAAPPSAGKAGKGK